jgi:NO-binding membrane sensor protein with MHYT domain/nitrogen-specific signal transduction histidine kinase/ActR/RegA family two-component response regulator
MPLDGRYSPALVVLSIFIASAASFTALELAARITAARGRERLAWVAGGSVAMGVGIWSMHFVGMLAFHLPIPITYGLGLVLLSVVVAIGASALALLIASRPSLGSIALIGGALWMGPAIAGMHYIGMAALSADARLDYAPGLVLASVAIAVLASLAGLQLAHRFRADESRRTRLARVGSALVFGAAIAGMHYTGMAAAHFSTPGHTGRPGGGVLASGELAAGVGIGALLILGTGLLGAMLDRRLRAGALVQERRRDAQKLEALGQLAGGIAHDFNNLLTAILGHAAFLKQDPAIGDESREDIEQIEAAASRAAELTRQLLAFGRRQVLEPRPILLNEVVADTMRMLGRVVGENIEVKVLSAPDLTPTMADPSQVTQILINLVVNARDAMPDGGLLTIETKNVEVDSVTLGQHLDAPPGSYVMLGVTDSGVGIAPEHQPRIFEPFFTTKGAGRGTGLGLSTVYGIVAQSGGSISVYSEPGHGSTFCVYFRQLVQAGAIAPVRPAGPAERLRGRETVLVVEDEDAVREFAARALRQYGYSVLIAGRPQEALLIAAEHPGTIDLVLADVIMPRTSGPGLMAKLRELRPSARVVFMSGFTENALGHHGVLESSHPFLQKPFSPEALARKIRETLTYGAAASE